MVPVCEDAEGWGRVSDQEAGVEQRLQIKRPDHHGKCSDSGKRPSNVSELLLVENSISSVANKHGSADITAGCKSIDDPRLCSEVSLCVKEAEKCARTVSDCQQNRLDIGISGSREVGLCQKCGVRSRRVLAQCKTFRLSICNQL
jgi:hypothetical protein